MGEKLNLGIERRRLSVSRNEKIGKNEKMSVYETKKRKTERKV